MLKVALYMRMSTDKQENSIDSQRKILESFAKNNNYPIVEEYIDEGISGRSADKRPAFMRMIEDSSQGIFNAVLVYDSSRFARNLEESIVYKSVLRRNSVALISITEPTLDDDSALITDAMLGAINEMYSRKLSKAVKRGMQYQARQGIYQVAPPYGYKKKDGVMEIVEEQAAVVKNIYQMFIEKPSYHNIVLRLNTADIKNRRGNPWDIRGVRSVLTKQAYIGNVYYSGELHKGVHEPIIDVDTWDKVQGLINKRPQIRSRPPSSYKHWLSGILKCGYCGAGMSCNTRQDGKLSYRCSKNTKGLCEHTNAMSVLKLERLALHAFLSVIGNEPVNYLQLTKKRTDEIDVETLEKSLKKIHVRLERHKKAYSAGIDSLEEYKANKESCLKEEQDIKKTMKTINDEKIHDEDIKTLKDSTVKLVAMLFSDKYSMEDKCLAIRNVVDKIVFNRDSGEFTVYYFV